MQTSISHSRSGRLPFFYWSTERDLIFLAARCPRLVYPNSALMSCRKHEQTFFSFVQVEFREDIKALFEKAVGGKSVTFLFNDNQVCACAWNRAMTACLLFGGMSPSVCRRTCESPA